MQFNQASYLIKKSIKRKLSFHLDLIKNCNLKRTTKISPVINSIYSGPHHFLINPATSQATGEPSLSTFSSFPSASSPSSSPRRSHFRLLKRSDPSRSCTRAFPATPTFRCQFSKKFYGRNLQMFSIS